MIERFRSRSEDIAPEDGCALDPHDDKTWLAVLVATVVLVAGNFAIQFSLKPQLQSVEHPRTWILYSDAGCVEIQPGQYRCPVPAEWDR